MEAQEPLMTTSSKVGRRQRSISPKLIGPSSCPNCDGTVAEKTPLGCWENVRDRGGCPLRDRPMPASFPPTASAKRPLDSPSGRGPKCHKGTAPHKASPAPLSPPSIIAASPPALPPPTEEPRRSRRLASMRKA